MGQAHTDLSLAIPFENWFGEATFAQNPNSENWRCILEIARTEFCPRPASRDSEWAGKMNYEAEGINNFKF